MERHKRQNLHNVQSSKTYLEIKKTITEGFSTSYKEQVLDLANRLMSGGGRRYFSLEELAKAR